MTGTDDIVTRLRSHVDVGTVGEDVLSIRNIPICLEAANEIERLRRELFMAQKWRDNYKLAFENSQKSCKYWHEKANSNNG